MTEPLEQTPKPPSSESTKAQEKGTISRKLGRRPFIKVLAGAFAGNFLVWNTSAGNTAQASPLPEIAPSKPLDTDPEKKAVLDKRLELEQKYGIKLTTAGELGIPPALTGGEGGPNKKPRPITPIEWNMQNLNVLEITLDTKVPSFFLQPVNDLPVVLALAQDGYNSGEVNNAICIPESLLSDEGIEQLADIIVHERTHKNNIKTFSADTRSVSSPWYGKVFKIFTNSKYQSGPPEIAGQLREYSVDLKAPYGSDAYLKARMKHAFTNNFPEELIAVAAELMRGDKERFDKAFGLVINNPDQIDQLADFVLKDIYQQQSS